MWIFLVVGLMLGEATSSLRCPDGLECKESHACCIHPGGNGYVCCDQPQLPGVSLRMLPPNTLIEGSGVACPDGSQCPLEYSCLRTPDASYGCCPWAEAVSCADGRHCCPRGFHCSADGRSCFQSPGLIPSATVDAVQCPDGESQCPNDSTCCPMADGSWGCCPMAEASCCEDKIHCCPHATTCDVAHSRCLSALGEQPLLTKFPARKRDLALALPQKNICPKNESTCPDTATCCPLLTGQYGCCPLQNAVCCSDRLHCCPQGTTCDLAHSKCTLAPWGSWLITGLLVDPPKARDVPCDMEHKCPDGNTCCRNPSGGWGCCPLEEAVCCSDQIHCCPKGYNCDLAAGTCQKGIDSIRWLAKSSANLVKVMAASVGLVVPCDPQTACPDGQTCCRLLTGAWGCCPLLQAVCCPDHLHCCPSGFRCGPGETCTNGLESIPWLEKRPAIVHVTSSSGDVRCDDQVSCPDGHTCCRLASGQWGCCPLPQAVCCPDHLHCCPSGFSCGPGGTCMNGQESIAWLEKRPAIVHVTSSRGDVRCDDEVSCLDGYTCCRLASGQWGCCPLPQAVCCPDHLHCCPTGYRCAPEVGSCEKDGESIPWLEKRPAILHITSSSRDVRCDDQVSCPDGHTCCRTKIGSWACCPLPQAVCCTDRAHCCPSGHTCDVQKGTCVPRSVLSIGLLAAPAAPRLVKCADRRYCLDGQTCCQLASGQWKCCNFSQAVCCSDHLHCCPNGYTCDLAHGGCQKSWNFLPWGPRHPAEPLQTLVVPCNSPAGCARGQSFRQSVVGTGSCCQRPNLVCCEDRQHCCPLGYTCNLKAQTCEKWQPQPLAAEGMQFSVSLSPSRSATSSHDVPCDARHYCHNGQTCCMSSTGGWACCPYDKGSCCSDRQHCCPFGFRCSRKGAYCERKGPLRWDASVFSSRSTQALPLL